MKGIAELFTQDSTGINQKNMNDSIPITLWVMSEAIMKAMLMF